jgi:SagB-type dehydrogenase family enzyme
MIALPKPTHEGAVSVETALLKRRSIREYTTAPLTLGQISQLLWSAQGVTNEQGNRTAPSAGATYPLETYLVAGKVEQLAPGIYRYDPGRHALVQLSRNDRRAALAQASLGQDWVRLAPASIVFTGILERTSRRYGARARQYVHMEAGHAAQNVYLQATALGIGTVIVGAFVDAQVSKALDLPEEEVPLAVLPVGVPADKNQNR